MRVRALKDCQVPDALGRGSTYRRGPEYNLAGALTQPGEEFEVADDLVVNREVLEVVVPPAGGAAVRYLKGPKATAGAVS